MGTSASSWAGSHCGSLLFNAPSCINARSRDIDHPSAHTGPGASFPDWACYLCQVLPGRPCQTNSIAMGCIPCPQLCKHWETHGKHFHQQEPKTQCPAKPATTPHIQRPQNLPRPGTAIPAWWQVAGNDSDASPVTRWLQGHWRYEAVPVAPISTPKMLGNPALVAVETKVIILPEPSPASPVGICIPLSYLAPVRIVFLSNQPLWHCK